MVGIILIEAGGCEAPSLIHGCVSLGAGVITAFGVEPSKAIFRIVLSLLKRARILATHWKNCFIATKKRFVGCFHRFVVGLVILYMNVG